MERVRWSLYLVGVAAVVAYVGVPVAEGCLCERRHPQQHFCDSSYAIGGHILKREFVRVESDINPAFLGPPPAGLAPALGEIEPLSEGLQPYPDEGLHLPDEAHPEGLEPFPEETEPFYPPRDLQPLPNPEGLEPLPLPGGLHPLPGLQAIPELKPQRHPEDVEPLPPAEELEVLPNPADLQPLPQEGGQEQPIEHPEGLKPLPHPEGLEPIPDGSKPESLPPLPLPEELTPQSENVTSNQNSSNAGSTNTTSTSKESSPEATTPAQKTSSTERVMTTTTAATQEETTTPGKDPDFDPGNVDPWNYKIVYTLKLSHIYRTGKEEASWSIGDEVQLSTPAADSQCGQPTLKTGKTYLIAGRRSGRVSLCDWVQEHHRLTSRQKQGLKLVYGKTCDTCHIKACPSSRHCSKPRNNKAITCLYDASQVRPGLPYSPFDCLASHSRCTMRHGNKCKWQKNNDFHDCMKNQLP